MRDRMFGVRDGNDEMLFARIKSLWMISLDPSSKDLEYDSGVALSVGSSDDADRMF